MFMLGLFHANDRELRELRMESRQRFGLELSIGDEVTGTANEQAGEDSALKLRLTGRCQLPSHIVE
jgi:hypothetical protein